MANWIKLGLTFGLVCALSGSNAAMAESPCAPDALGVSRTIEVDTTGGPWFGAPHGDPNFLNAGEVVLTFDDGPSPKDTREVLAALAQQCTKATFFVVGEMVVVHPEVVNEVADQGHTIGTHTWTHPNLARFAREDMTKEIEATFNAAQKAAGQSIAPFFRYPYLSSSQTSIDYLKERNIGQFAIDVDSNDWRVRSSKAVVTRIMAGLKEKGRGIILMHDIHKWTADAVPQVLAALKAGGYKVVHLKAKETLQLVSDITPPAPKTHPFTRFVGRKWKRAASHAKSARAIAGRTSL